LDDGQLKDKNKKPAQQENSKISKELILIPVMIEVLKNITNLICRAVCILQLDLNTIIKLGIRTPNQENFFLFAWAFRHHLGTIRKEVHL
jgi:hypothetical protein